MKYGENELYQVIITPGIDNERLLTCYYLYEEELNSNNYSKDSMEFDAVSKSTT